MKAPDKIVIFPDDYPTLWYMPDGWETVPSGNVEYIRKEALLEWLEQNRNQAQMWFDRYNDREDLSAKQVWEKVIDKLNEM